MDRVAELEEWVSVSHRRKGKGGVPKAPAAQAGARGASPQAAGAGDGRGSTEGGALAVAGIEAGSVSPAEPVVASWALPGDPVEVPCAVGSIQHLIQDEATVARIHEE